MEYFLSREIWSWAGEAGEVGISISAFRAWLAELILCFAMVVRRLSRFGVGLGREVLYSVYSGWGFELRDGQDCSISAFRARLRPVL